MQKGHSYREPDFEDGYAYIYNRIQEERIRFAYQSGARHVQFISGFNLHFVGMLGNGEDTEYGFLSG